MATTSSGTAQSSGARQSGGTPPASQKYYSGGPSGGGGTVNYMPTSQVLGAMFPNTYNSSGSSKSQYGTSSPQSQYGTSSPQSQYGTSSTQSQYGGGSPQGQYSMTPKLYTSADFSHLNGSTPYTNAGAQGGAMRANEDALRHARELGKSAEQQARANVRLTEAQIRAINNPKTYAADPTSYANAMQSFSNYINQGLQGYNQNYNTGLANVLANTNQSKDIYKQQYNLGRGELASGYDRGIDTLQQGLTQGTNALTSNYDAAIGLYNPYIAGAGDWMNQYADRVGQNFDASYAAYQDSPVYQFGLSEGLKGIQSQAAARGMLGSGATLKSVGRYANDYAQQQYNDYNNTRIAQAQQLAAMGLQGVQGAAGLYQGKGQGLADLGVAYNVPMAQTQVGRGQDLSQYDQAYATNYAGLNSQLSDYQMAGAAAKAQAAADAAGAQASQSYESIVNGSMGWR